MIIMMMMIVLLTMTATAIAATACVQVRVFAPEDQINQAHYAVEVAVKVLNYYNDFFGVDYPLPKQGMH